MKANIHRHILALVLAGPCLLAPMATAQENPDKAAQTAPPKTVEIDAQRKVFHLEEAARHLRAAGATDKADGLSAEVAQLKDAASKALAERNARSATQLQQAQTAAEHQKAKLDQLRKAIDELKQQLSKVHSGLEAIGKAAASDPPSGAPQPAAN